MLCVVYVCCQDDEDGHLTALHIIQDLMTKSPQVFLDHFARLGVFNKVLGLAGPPPEEEEENGARGRADDKVCPCVHAISTQIP